MNDFLKTVLLHPQMTAAGFYLYCKILNIANSRGVVCCAVTDLCTYRSSLTNPMDTLINCGFLRVKVRPGKKNIYKIKKGDDER